MNNNQFNNDFWKSIAAIITFSTALVWISSYLQLSIFGNFEAPKQIKMVGYLWVGGIVFDLFSLFCYTIMGAILKKDMSPLVGLGWIVYFLSNAIYPQPSLFRYNVGALLSSVIKLGEFLLLSFFHLICVVIIPDFVEKYIEETGSRE